MPTEVVVEQFRAGEPTEIIADLFDVPVTQVEQAVRFELSWLAPPAVGVWSAQETCAVAGEQAALGSRA
ncbi:MAG: hypothetical protein ACR2GH_09260 [Pseudonocardia sp.]